MLVTLCVGAAAACAPPGGSTSEAVGDARLRGAVPVPSGARATRVIRTIDGDSLVLAGVGRARLIGVDAPEVRGGAECYGFEATEFARRTLPPRRRVRFARGREARDRYGRALVYVWLGDGRSFNAMLVEGGYATVLTIPPNDRYARRFRVLAREARRARRGLWSRDACAGDRQ